MNRIYIYIYIYIYDLYANNLLVTLFLNELNLIHLYTVNGLKYCNPTPIIIFNINLLFAHS